MAGRLQWPGAGSAAPGGRFGQRGRHATEKTAAADGTGDLAIGDAVTATGDAATATGSRSLAIGARRRCALRAETRAQSAAAFADSAESARSAREAPAIAAMADARPRRRAAVAKAVRDSRSTRPGPRPCGAGRRHREPVDRRRTGPGQSADAARTRPNSPGARRAAQRARQGRRAACRAAPEPGRDRAGVGAHRDRRDPARVEFGADLAATRQVIEAGLPELAERAARCRAYA